MLLTNKWKYLLLLVLLIPVTWLTFAFLISTTLQSAPKPDLKPDNISEYYHLADYLMTPIMYVLGGFKADSIQHTHPWHMQAVNSPLINLDLATPPAKGDDNSRFSKSDSFLFHVPILGGWKEYSIYECSTQNNGPFYIGFMQKNADDSVEKSFIIKTPIYGDRVRMLNGSPIYTTIFFAVDKNGKQLPIKKVGKGTLGREADTKIPLL